MLIIRIILLLICLFPIAGIANGQINQTKAPPPQTDDKPKHFSETDDLTKASAEPITLNASDIHHFVSSIKDQISNLKENMTQEKYDNWLKNFIDGIKITDIIVAIFTIVIGVYTWRLWVSTTGLWQESIKQGDNNLRAIEASERAAEAATISAKASQKSATTLQSLERAYLFIEKVRLQSPPFVDLNKTENITVGNNMCDIIIKNHGRTQAIITCIDRWAQVYNKIPEFKLGDCVRKKGGIMPKIETIIGGEQEISIPTSFFIEKEELSAVISDSQRLLCVGIIKYKDIFGKFYKTGFCWWYEPLTTKDFHFLDHPNNYHT